MLPTEFEVKRAPGSVTITGRKAIKGGKARVASQSFPTDEHGYVDVVEVRRWLESLDPRLGRSPR